MGKIRIVIPAKSKTNNRNDFLIAEQFYYLINKKSLKNPTIIRTHFLTQEMAQNYGKHNLENFEVLIGTDAIELGVEVDSSEGLKHNKYVSINSILARKRLRRFNKRRGHKISEYKISRRFINEVLYSQNRNYPGGFTSFLLRYKRTFIGGNLLTISEWPKNDKTLPWIMEKLKGDYNKASIILRIALTLTNNGYVFKPYSLGKVAYYLWVYNKTRILKWEKHWSGLAMKRIRYDPGLIENEFILRGFKPMGEFKRIKAKAISSIDGELIYPEMGLKHTEGWALFYKLLIPGYTRIIQ